MYISVVPSAFFTGTASHDTDLEPSFISPESNPEKEPALITSSNMYVSKFVPLLKSEAIKIFPFPVKLPALPER